MGFTEPSPRYGQTHDTLPSAMSQPYRSVSSNPNAASPPDTGFSRSPGQQQTGFTAPLPRYGLTHDTLPSTMNQNFHGSNYVPNRYGEQPIAFSMLSNSPNPPSYLSTGLPKPAYSDNNNNYSHSARNNSNDMHQPRGNQAPSNYSHYSNDGAGADGRYFTPREEFAGSSLLAHSPTGREGLGMQPLGAMGSDSRGSSGMGGGGGGAQDYMNYPLQGHQPSPRSGQHDPTDLSPDLPADSVFDHQNDR